MKSESAMSIPSQLTRQSHKSVKFGPYITSMALEPCPCHCKFSVFGAIKVIHGPNFICLKIKTISY